jgi:hypothetical protein
MLKALMLEAVNRPKLASLIIAPSWLDLWTHRGAGLRQIGMNPPDCLNLLGQLGIAQK